MRCSSVKSHLFCLQKVLQAGQLIHMLTSYTCPAAPSRARANSFVSSNLQSFALLFIPNCAAELLTICCLTLLILSTNALAHSHKCTYRLKGHSLPRGWYSCSLEDGIFFQMAPWEPVEKVHSLFGGSLCVCMCTLFP